MLLSAKDLEDLRDFKRAGYSQDLKRHLQSLFENEQYLDLIKEEIEKANGLLQTSITRYLHQDFLFDSNFIGETAYQELYGSFIDMYVEAFNGRFGSLGYDAVRMADNSVKIKWGVDDE